VSDFDGIIVGGGHNGLTCAAYLAKAGTAMPPPSLAEAS
jgi:phytoene dehydrogenase-like protein